ncbi:ankyrin repeat domain-containing protein [Aurantiacibacter zhengii]|uniref:Ankyrin repeat domain-containing protein n=2 Tax=Aurantiacibacter zhengii TaxID=2307003 RepID=A0A418NRH8_9SPHN|nr:ankyrin repeat domain-containing protein [Aurantiacibacter zhengii]
MSLIKAVEMQDREQVATLASTGADLEQRNDVGQTPLVLASKTDQFVIAEILLDAGADPFAADMFGWTAGYAVQTTRLTGGKEFEARERVREKLKAHGYRIPGPNSNEIMELVDMGNWPPARWNVPSQAGMGE